MLLHCQPLFEKRDQRRDYLLRRFDVWDVPETGEQQHAPVAVGNRLRKVMHPFLKPRGGSEQRVLGSLLVGEGLGLILFSQMRTLPAAIAAMVLFALFTKMASGGTYAVVPFLNRRALGSVAGIIGAGGNFGAVVAGLLFRDEGFAMSTAFAWLGVAVTACASLTLFVRFSSETEEREREMLEAAMAAR